MSTKAGTNVLKSEANPETMTLENNIPESSIPKNTVPDYIIRACTTFADFSACLNLQREVWQFTDLDITPLRSFIITLHSGGMTYGAFDGEGKLLGFSHALAAFDERLRPYYYSHMLAVEPALQSAGIGGKLKLAQRDHALRAGVSLIKWTFDPLQSRNAYLNIIKLGAVIRQYKVNYYGNASTSALHRGLDTDRVFAEWWVKSRRVADAQAGIRQTAKPVAAVEVPRDIEVVKKQDLAEAIRRQAQLRAEFQRLLGEGLYCAGFEADPNGNSRYLFFKDEHQEEVEIQL
ncbi:MAG TPA: GNAT family N-acetyltransferase [Blastocatellia bacterium]|nr:GNAT family N-acetyltransferase [Blastocatellia bacterium]